MTTVLLKKQRNVYPGLLSQNQMFRLSETLELSMEETHHHVLQFVYGARKLWRQERDGCHLTENRSLFLFKQLVMQTPTAK